MYIHILCLVHSNKPQTWLLCIEIAHANFSGICFLTMVLPPPILNTHLTDLMTSVTLQANFITG